MNIRGRTIVSKWMPVIIWMLTIFAGSGDVLSAQHTSRFLIPFLRWLDPNMSFQTIFAVHMALRKVGHFTEYAVLTLLLWRALRGTFTALGKGTLAIAVFLLCASFAASDEFHQSFIPSRTASAHDVMIDCIGVFSAVLFCVLVSRRRVLPPEKALLGKS